MIPFSHLILPAGIIVGALVLGFIFEKIFLARLEKFVARTKWKTDDLLVKPLRGTMIFLFVLAGLYTALSYVDLDSSARDAFSRIIIVLGIVLAGVVTSRIASELLHLFARRAGKNTHVSSIFTTVARMVVFSIALLMVLNTLGIAITPLLTALGVGGLAVALAVQPTLADLFSGLQLIMSKEVQQDDYIKLDSGIEGYVTDINWRNTTIRGLAHTLTIIPNSKVASSLVTNFSKPEPDISVSVEVGVSYKSDLEKVERVTVEVAKEVMREVEGGVPDFEPVVRFHTFADSSINCSVVLRSREFIYQFKVKHEFIKRLHRRFQKEGIEIPFPSRVVYTKP